MAQGDSTSHTGLLKYANGNFTGGPPSSNPGLLNVFTDVGGTILSSGEQMKPQSNYPARFVVNSGSYAGTYYINHNDQTGYTMATDHFIYSGRTNIDLLHAYTHWPNDQMMAISNFNNNTPWGCDMFIRANGQFVLNASNITNGGGQYDPTSNGGNLDYYANFPGSNGAFTPSAVNTDWTINFAIGINAGTPPMQAQNWTIDVYDGFGITLLYSTGGIVNLATPGGPPFPMTFSDSFNCPYWSMLMWDINVN